MPVIYNNTVKTARMQVVLDALNAGTGNATVEVGTSGMGTVLVSFTLPDPVGTLSGSTLTIDCDPDVTALGANTGTAAEARLKDANGTVVISGLTVGISGSGADVIISPSTSITATQTTSLTNLSFTHG